jgi:hypothetical protein
MYIYLDESGCLGFDFNKQGTSRFFVITLLVIYSDHDNRKMLKMVERVIKNKISKRKSFKNSTVEFKGTNSNIAIKSYFYNFIKDIEFEIFTIILNKARVVDKLRKSKEKLYNFVSKQLLVKCEFSKAQNRVILTVDKRKNKEGVKDFNNYLFTQLRKLIPLHLPFEQYHTLSYEHKGLQAADLFCWGVYRKYERGDNIWYKYFQDKIKAEIVYLPEKKSWF